MEHFWNWQKCRTFTQEAIRHYKHAPGWFTNWLDDLCIRLDENCGAITLDEVQTLGMLSPENDGVWAPENYAVNSVYKFFDRAGRDTTGIAGY